MATRLKRYLKSFTLIELIIVIAIIAVLGATAFLLLTQWMSKGRDATKISTIRTIKTALDINFTARGDYPIPEDAVEHTASNGTKLYQGYVGGNMVAELQRTPIDPTTKKPYIYSYMKPTGSVGYYQIGTTIENTVGYEGYNLAKADIVQTAKIIGNYEFDPSLPSLIIVGGNETSKGIYDPSNCYVLDGGKNTVDGAQCEPKKDMPLKDYDNGLVGYWDMESYISSGTKVYFTDNSGYGNHGEYSGGFNQTLLDSITGSVIGKGLFFDGSGSHLYMGNPDILQPTNHFTIKAIVKPFEEVRAQRIFRKRLYGYGFTYSSGSFSFTMYDAKPSINNHTIYSNNSNLNEYYLIDGIYDGLYLKFYINGVLVSSKKTQGLNNIYYETGGIAIGRDGNSSSLTSYFNGIIDEVKIYNRALSESEILQQAKIAGF